LHLSRASRVRVHDASGVRILLEARRFLTRMRDALRYDADDLQWYRPNAPVQGWP
jgi:hypothetical protein